MTGTLIKREVLYDEVWAEPMTKVAARYGTTAPKLAKVCDQLDVPHPSSGYWVQLAHGTAHRSVRHSRRFAPECPRNASWFPRPRARDL
jgi:hypothetical protein